MDDRAAQTAEDDDASKRRMEMTKDMGLLECTQTAVVVMSDDRELEPEEQPTVTATAAVSDRKWGDYPLTSDEVALLEQQEQMKETAAYVHKLRDELSEARAQAAAVQEKLEEMTSKFEAAQGVAESATAELEQLKQKLASVATENGRFKAEVQVLASPNIAVQRTTPLSHLGRAAAELNFTPPTATSSVPAKAPRSTSAQARADTATSMITSILNSGRTWSQTVHQEPLAPTSSLSETDRRQNLEELQRRLAEQKEVQRIREDQEALARARTEAAAKTASRAAETASKRKPIGVGDLSLVQVFKQLDTDRSGTLTAAELKRALESLGFSGADAMAQEVMGMVDSDGNREIDLVEFVGGLPAGACALIKSQLNADGLIEAFVATTGERALSLEATPALVTQTTSRVDENGWSWGDSPTTDPKRTEVEVLKAGQLVKLKDGVEKRRYCELVVQNGGLPELRYFQKKNKRQLGRVVLFARADRPDSQSGGWRPMVEWNFGVGTVMKFSVVDRTDQSRHVFLTNTEDELRTWTSKIDAAVRSSEVRARKVKLNESSM